MFNKQISKMQLFKKIKDRKHENARTYEMLANTIGFTDLQIHEDFSSYISEISDTQIAYLRFVFKSYLTITNQTIRQFCDRNNLSRKSVDTALKTNYTNSRMNTTKNAVAFHLVNLVEQFRPELQTTLSFFNKVNREIELINLKDLKRK